MITDEQLANLSSGPPADHLAIDRCGFCNKQRLQLAELIVGPITSICDECIGLCNEIIAEHLGRKE